MHCLLLTSHVDSSCARLRWGSMSTMPLRCCGSTTSTSRPSRSKMSRLSTETISPVLSGVSPERMARRSLRLSRFSLAPATLFAGMIPLPRHRMGPFAQQDSPKRLAILKSGCLLTSRTETRQGRESCWRTARSISSEVRRYSTSGFRTWLIRGNRLPKHPYSSGVDRQVSSARKHHQEAIDIGIGGLMRPNSLILGKPPGKVYNNLRTVSSRMKERF